MISRTTTSSSTPFDPLRPSHHLPFPNGRVYPTVALTCGHEYEDDNTWDRRARATPQFLPSPFPPPVALPPPTQTRKSTGCGEAVHSGVTMHWRPHTPQPEAWRAPAAGTSPNVIPLEEKYFDHEAARALGFCTLGECGCVLEGVGCRVCGNALSARLAPCAAHGSAIYRYNFLPGNVSPPLPLQAARPRTFLEHETREYAPSAEQIEQEEIFMREVLEAERTRVQRVEAESGRFEAEVGAASHGRARMLLPRPPYTGRGVLYGRVTDTDTGTAYAYAYGEPARVVRVPVHVVREGEGMETAQAGEFLDSELATAAERAVRRRWR
ncbi:hypothetical protein B0H11DRAFT_2348794 [Mycena galericulata]|nr:hypothetical protein B0H11DRAFT_2348794 [Mycena galericulata]